MTLAKENDTQTTIQHIREFVNCAECPDFGECEGPRLLTLEEFKEQESQP